MLIEGTLDANGNFVTPSKPIVYETEGLVTIQGTLDEANNFVYATRQPVAFQANGSINLQGTLDANGNFVKASFRPPAVLTSDDLRIHGTLAANGSFIQPSKPLVYQLDGTNLIQGTLAANGSFIATLRGNVWNGAVTDYLRNWIGGATIAVNLSGGTDFGGSTPGDPLALTGNPTLGAPSGVINMKKGLLWFQASGATRTLTLHANWLLAEDVEEGPYEIASGKLLGIAYACRGSTVYVTGIARF